MRRKTHEQYVTDLQEVNPHWHIKNMYINSRTKVTIEDDRCGHIWDVIPTTPLRGIGCPYCSNRKKRTYEEFLNDLSLNNKNIVILTTKEEYINGSTKVHCKCKIDNFEWFTTPSSLLQGKGCPKCYGYISEDEFIEKLSIVKPTIVLEGKYLGSKTKVMFRCLIDGCVWDATPYHILHDSGCPMCKSRKQSERQLLSHEEYVNRLKEVNNNIIPIEEYRRNNIPILHKCLKCGYEWYAYPNYLMSDHGCCPKCNCTRGESRIMNFLNDYNIEYIFQKTFDNLKYKNSLFYDFYLPSLNTLIEYDGEFHYIDIFNNGTFEEGKIRDNIKTEYATKNNITLIRIPYWEFNNIENILKTQLIV